MSLPTFTAPKDVAANLAYRRRVLKLCATNREAQREFWIASSRDIVFWLDTFGWTYANLLYPEAPDRPFVTWPYQEDCLRRLGSAYGKHDLLIEKSRDMGMTWKVVANYLHRVIFRRGQSMLIASRNQDLVDENGNTDCIFWKLDYLYENLPRWMRPPILRNLLVFQNQLNGSVINGSSTTQNLARGGRRQSIFLDEFPAVENAEQIGRSTSQSTKNRIFGGTPMGAYGEFYDRRQRMRATHPERVITMHWSMHPQKNVGLWMDETGKFRSPWYDEECSRESPQTIAQELDIDYAASSWREIDAKTLEQLIKTHARPPLARGEMSYQPGHAGKWLPGPHGRLLLWINLIDDAPPTDDDYVVGADISMGKGGEGSSQSVAAVWSRRTKTKVAEFKTPHLDPAEFAEYCVAICKWFKGRGGKGAYLIWERNGPGAIFKKRVMDHMHYGNVFMGAAEERPGRPKGKIPGFQVHHTAKNALLLEYFRALREGSFINRSEAALLECAEYDHAPDGSISHGKARNSNNPTEKHGNHGDIVIGDALAYRAMQDFGALEEEAKTVVPLSCYKRRRDERDRQRRNESYY